MFENQANSGSGTKIENDREVMLKKNNNKRNITIAIGILVAIVIILSSFGPSMAEGVLSSKMSLLPKASIGLPDLQHVVKTVLHIYL